MVKNNIKLVLEFQFDLKNPLKQPKMRIFEKWKIIAFGQNYGIFWPKGDLEPCITSLPYFGVKLSCVCLMFAYRKNIILP